MAPIRDLDVWFANELAKLYATEPTNNPGILLAFPVWGAKYIDRFAEFCMPSLLAPANAEALRAMNAKILIYTPPGDFVPLWRKTAPIERAGIRLEFSYIPKDLLAGPDPNHKYQLLGTVQNLAVQRAARSGMGFHMIMPDVVYNDRYFAALAGMVGEHEAIALGCLSANIETIAPDLEAFNRGGFLCMPSRELGAMAWRHVHKQTLGHMMNGASDDDMPQSNVMVWLGRDTVHMAGPHINPAWMSPRLCRHAPVLTPVSLDAEIPPLMPDGFHLPGPDDDMVLVELSDDGKGAPVRGGIAGFIAICWLQMNFNSDYLPVLSRRTSIRIGPQSDGMDDADIERHHAALVEKIVTNKLGVMEAWMKDLSRNNRPMLRH